MPIPNRTQPGDYHYHVYDYPGSAPWQLSPAVARRGNQCFYSMFQDLQGLYNTAQTSGIPHPALTTLPAQIDADGATFHIQVLSIGGTATPAPSQVVITGGVHAREWVGTELAYLVAEYMVKNYNAPANQYGDKIREILDSRRIHFIPMVNPAGNQYSVMSDVDGSRMWRKNRRVLPTDAAGWQAELVVLPAGTPQPPFRDVQENASVLSYDVPRYRTQQSPPYQYDRFKLPNRLVTGVDINRNLPTAWFGFNCDDMGDPESNTYFGTSAGSEVETQNVGSFLGLVDVIGRINTSIDYHSYGQFILYPTEQFDAHAVDASYVNLGEALQRLIMPSLGWAFSYDYQLGSPLKLVDYNATGTVADRVSQANHARSFTIELDPSGKRGLQGFNLPPDQIMGVFEKNIRGALALMGAGNVPTTFATKTYFGLFDRKTVTSGERVFLDWDVYGRGNQLPV
jgi:hypothetical protein